MNENKKELIWQDRKHHLWFPWSFTKYYIEDDRLMLKKGLLSTTLDETLLYRILDITLKQSFGGKIFGTGNLVIKAKVDHSPEMILENISKPYEIRRLLSELVEECRKKQNVVGKEFYGESGQDHFDMDGDGHCDLGE